MTGLLAGSYGALLGLGGGVIVIPILTMFFHMPIQTAVGISLVGVIATSTGAAIVYVSEVKADLRLGMILELGTTIGAILGAVTAGYVSARALYLLYAVVVLYNAYSMYRSKEAASGQRPAASDQSAASGQRPAASDQSAASGQRPAASDQSVASGQWPVASEETGVKNIPSGLALSSLAGVMSGLLGVGGGLIKIPVMYLLMGIPLKTAVATSNFMIGVTATAGAFIYYLNGRINAAVAVPVALGVFAGALFGKWAGTKVSTTVLRKVFIFVFLYVAIQMGLKGLGQ
ncbi:MAG: sulfite exporter TauE/SafE family protein [Firmicutes bacterium HGW-Firmicutes-8]|nr:MAG: sulfite exporter TauE/SafE family protein [Firmicutes bacterium HGW-Firmicutes-8]